MTGIPIEKQDLEGCEVQSSLGGWKHLKALATGELTERRRPPKILSDNFFLLYPTSIVLTSEEVVGSSTDDAGELIFLFFILSFCLLTFMCVLFYFFVCPFASWNIRVSSLLASAGVIFGLPH